MEDAGLAEDTIVFFCSDHGVGMPMCKKWVWDWGLRVPLLIRFPKKHQDLAPGGPGMVTDRLVSFVDFPPTLFSLVGVDVPAHMQGKAFLGAQAQPPRDYAFAIRDRMAEWYETIRVVRDKKYQYHRNFMPHLSWAPFCSYTLTMPTGQVWTRLHEEGKLEPVQDRYFHPKPTEELYDLEAEMAGERDAAKVPKLVALLGEDEPVIRWWATLGLVMLGEQARPAESSLEKLLSDDSPLVRVAAAEGLFQLG